LRRAALLLAATVTAVAFAVAGCNYSVVVTQPPLGSVDPGPTGDPGYTEVPIGVTPWPNGTTGPYGMRIDPSLSSSLPSYVGGNPLVEDANTEALDLADKDYGDAFEALYVAQVGDVAAPNWVQASLARVRGGAVGDEFYASWRDRWFAATCSQAGGVATKAQESINDFQVDVATCGGGARAYTLSLGDGMLLSVVDLGPRRLGRQLIEALQ
jgi:hypothetical protein